MWSLGGDKICSVLTLHILQGQIPDPRREVSYSQIKRCMCVEYLVVNLILLCFLKYISLLWNIFVRTWVIFILISFLFPPFFSFLPWTSFVSIVLYFCITHVSFYNKLLREILSRIWSIYSDKAQQIYCCLLPVQEQNILKWMKNMSCVLPVQKQHIYVACT